MLLNEDEGAPAPLTTWQRLLVLLVSMVAVAGFVASLAA